jgi:hypothetical protein
MSGLDDLFSEAEQVQKGLVASPPPVQRTMPPPEELSLMDRLLAKVPTGLVNNPAVAGARTLATLAAGPTMGGAQLIANAFPNSTGVPDMYNRRIADVLRKDKEAQVEEGPVAAAANEFAGSMLSPLSVGMSGAKAAVTAGQRAIQGAGFGAIGGATSPVEVGDSGKFWGQKTGQTVVGTVTGGITAPIVGAIGDRVLARINRAGFDPTKAAAEADNIINSALKDSNQTLADLPPDQLSGLRAQVTNALAKGQKLDAAAALRLKDFEAEGMTPLQGWVTRDPMQWAAEQNVRGVKGAGEKVGDVIATGNRDLTQKIGQFGANAQEPAVASQNVAGALRQYGEQQQGGVRSAYTAARQSAGKDLDVPLEGLAQQYAQVLEDFGDKVPSAIQAKFRALGLDPAQPSNQKKVFTFEDADKLRKVINDHVGSDTTTNKALARIRSALNETQQSVDASGGPFAPAVSAARELFQQQRDVPALSNVMEGPVDDRFVKQAVINNPSTPEVQRLASLLRQQAPDQYQQVREQIGAHLAQAAFGDNAAGDTAAKQAGYNKALRTLGTGKLEAFFAPDEVEQMKRLGRIAAYQVAPPAGAASNYSNTASTVANLLRLTGGFVPVAGKPIQFAGDKLEAHSALRPNVPVSPNLSAEQRQMLSRALLALSGAGAAGAGRVIGEQP